MHLKLILHIKKFKNDRRAKKAVVQIRIDDRRVEPLVQIKIKGENFSEENQFASIFRIKRDVMTTYSCNICNQNFTDKNIRDRHRKNICVSSITVRKQNGEEKTIEKVNGKFNCVCERSFSRTDHFSSHWKECQIQGKLYYKE